MLLLLLLRHLLIAMLCFTDLRLLWMCVVSGEAVCVDIAVWEVSLKLCNKSWMRITCCSRCSLSELQDYFGRNCLIGQMLQRWAVYASFKDLMNRLAFLFDEMLLGIASWNLSLYCAKNIKTLNNITKPLLLVVCRTNPNI